MLGTLASTLRHILLRGLFIETAPGNQIAFRCILLFYRLTLGCAFPLFIKNIQITTANKNNI
jgi:hypothetical protein